MWNKLKIIIKKKDRDAYLQTQDIHNMLYI